MNSLSLCNIGRAMTAVALVALLSGGTAQAQPEPVLFEGCGRFDASGLFCDVFIADVPVNGCDRFELARPWGPQYSGDRVLIRGTLRYDLLSACMAGCAFIDNYTTSSCFCCQGATGNVDCDLSETTDISDLSALIDNLYISFTPLCCRAEANCDGSLDGNIDIADLSSLIGYLYISFTPTAECR